MEVFPSMPPTYANLEHKMQEEIGNMVSQSPSLRFSYSISKQTKHIPEPNAAFTQIRPP